MKTLPTVEHVQMSQERSLPDKIREDLTLQTCFRYFQIFLGKFIPSGYNLWGYVLDKLPLQCEDRGLLTFARGEQVLPQCVIVSNSGQAHGTQAVVSVSNCGELHLGARCKIVSLIHGAKINSSF
jgi:hypothetical protein